MITFKQYINEASRSSVVDVDEFIKWADSHAKKYLEGSHFLFRGSKTTGRNLSIGSSINLEKPRKSANTHNLYTLWMDNNSMFKNYPKRSQSWIVTDNLDTAIDFGVVSLLIVEDSAKIGLTNAEDLWDMEILDGVDTVKLNILSYNILKAFGFLNVETYKELEYAFKYITLEKMDEALKELNDADSQNRPKISRSKLSDFIDIMKNENVNSMYELWEVGFNPKHFKLSDGKTISSTPANGEAWVEGQVGFIPIFKSYINKEDRKKLIDWSEKYPNFKSELLHNWDNGYGVLL